MSLWALYWCRHSPDCRRVHLDTPWFHVVAATGSNSRMHGIGTRLGGWVGVWRRY